MNTRFELMREHVDLKKAASVGLLADVIDKLTDELRLLADRIKALEAEAAKPVMIYSGEWIEGSEYDAGNLVEYAGGVHVAVQPTNDNQPPSRFTGWAKLPMEA